MRTMRLADGPDEVHCRTIARLEYGRYGMEKTAAKV
jgi:acyl-CoA dehydrogenase